jgi:hypothetical protein
MFQKRSARNDFGKIILFLDSQSLADPVFTEKAGQGKRPVQGKVPGSQVGNKAGSTGDSGRTERCRKPLRKTMMGLFQNVNF